MEMLADEFNLRFFHAYDSLAASADLKFEPEDFVVVEAFDESQFSGVGEHVCLQIRKRNQNTRWVASVLASVAGVADHDVGFCGMKDRRALTTQWFSVVYPGQGWLPELLIPDCEILGMVRHQRKLRRGSHSGNHFVIRLRNVSTSVKEAVLDGRLAQIAKSGVPNYFGDQRFGINAQNLTEADRLLRRGRLRKIGGRQGLYISAARSYLFNLVLSQRVKQKCWLQAQRGEPRPQGPLWGRGRSSSTGPLAELESSVLADYQPWCNALEHLGLSQQRRDLQLVPEKLEWHWQERDVLLSFRLPIGAYATSVLRELLNVNTPKRMAVL